MPVQSRLSSKDKYLIDSIKNYMFSHLIARLSDFYFDEGDFFYAPEDIILVFTSEEYEVMQKLQKIIRGVEL